MKHLHIPREAYIPEILILKWSNNMEILMKTYLYGQREIYHYRYALGECFHEFGIPGEATGEIYNVDVYVSGQMPIYDYGEEIVED